jgi:acyl-CoA synthetase (NDP forming)
VYPINPNYVDVLGTKCYPSLADLPQTPDVAAVCLPSAAAVEAAEECGRLGIRGVAVVAGGFAESGPEGGRLQDRLKQIARRYGLAVVGPNSLGIVNRAARVCYWAGLHPSENESGIAAVVQSGALALSMSSMLFERRIALDIAVMPGNEAALTASDHLAYVLEQPSIRVVAVLLDGVRDPQGFVRAARRAADLGKRIIVLKVGQSEGGRMAAAAHTAALAGSDSVFSAVCRDLGVVRVADVDELLETTILASRLAIPPAPRAIITTVSGAGCGVVADLAASVGLPLPEPTATLRALLSDVLPGTTPLNPLDVAPAFDIPGSYQRCLDIVADSGEYDLQVTVINCPRSNDSNQEFDRSLVVDAATSSQSRGRPVIITSFSSGQFDEGILDIAQAASVSVLQGLRETLIAIKRLSDSADEIQRLLAESSSVETNAHGTALARSVEDMDGIDARRLLNRYGIKTAHQTLVTTLSEVVPAASVIGYPVVMKIASPDVPHKSDVGGVVLSVPDAVRAEAAFRAISENVAALAPSARIDGVMVEEMVPGVAELIVGSRLDPQFGPIVLVGMGGVTVEVVHDFAVSLAPVSHERAASMLRSLRGYPLLVGFRGRPAADVDAVINVIVNLSRLAVDFAGQFQALEINPLVVAMAGKGAIAVDYLLSP